MSTQQHKLAIFDLDGTLADKGVVPPSVINGISHLHDLNYTTAISTGRGYVRLREVLGVNFETIISPNALIIVEHGTKIVERNGNVVFGEYFSTNEIDHIIDFIRANIGIFKLAWYNPLDVKLKIPVWCANERDVQAESDKRGHYAEVYTSSIGELKERLLGQKFTNISLKLQDHITVENLKLTFTRTDTNVIFQDGNMEFIKSNINKGLSVLYVAKKLGYELSDMLLAGNAINDVEMLDIGAATTILVSKELESNTILSSLSNPTSIITVDTPHDLGNYLQKL